MGEYDDGGTVVCRLSPVGGGWVWLVV